MVSATLQPDRAITGDTRRVAGRLLTVLVPAYNEAGTIAEVLRRVLALPYDKQVIVVDDGSTDGTSQILGPWRNEPVVEVFRHQRNRGKGAAIRTGLQHAQGHFTIIQDADLEYDPQDYSLILEPLLAGRAEVVYGSRYLRYDGTRREGLWCFRCGVSLLNFCARLLYGARLTDVATCYKAFLTTRLRAMDLECDRFDFCEEVTAKACRLGLKIVEVPIGYHPRGFSQGKKIRCYDGFAAVWALWKWRRWQSVK